MRKILLFTLVIVLLTAGNVQAMDVDVWHVVETHTQYGKVIEKQVVDVYRSKEEAQRKSPQDYIIPEEVVRVTVPARTETRYWLVEMQNSGNGWNTAGRQTGPYETRAEARQNNPGTRTERDNSTKYYIREVSMDYFSYTTNPTGRSEGPFSSRAAAQDRVRSLGTRAIRRTDYIGSLYLDEGFNSTMARPNHYKTPTLLTSRTYSSLSEARTEVRDLIRTRTSTAGTITISEPLPDAVINLFGYLGVLSSRSSLLYSGFKLVAPKRDVGAYVGLVERKQTDIGVYFWQTYSSYVAETINYRWDINTVRNYTPERVERRTVPQINVTYSIEKDTVPVDVTIHLSR
ncbi:MAG: hypothetical protein NUK65_04365 [Firmicutes bacterium]|nr:hypothetical protein [Bacillota bacterium]